MKTHPAAGKLRQNYQTLRQLQVNPSQAGRRFCQLQVTYYQTSKYTEVLDIEEMRQSSNLTLQGEPLEGFFGSINVRCGADCILRHHTTVELIMSSIH